MSTPAKEPNFDRVAGVYRWAEHLALGGLLQLTREHYLRQVAASKVAFVLGDGDGRFLAKLLASNERLQALAVDTSERMLALLQKRCAFAAERLQAKHASALTVAPLDHTDLIVTHFFLDCLTQADVGVLIPAVAASCKPGTIWLVSDFQVPKGAIRRRLAAAYIRLLYLVFKWLTGLQVQQLPETRRVFLQAGFTRIAYYTLAGGMLYTELWRLDGER